MKKITLFIALLFCFNVTIAQVVFCPSGAEWRALYLLSRQMPDVRLNFPITYTGDTLINNTNCKVLSHEKFHIECNLPNSPMLTVIKQVGDTIFFRNKYTYHNWEILYNFAALTNDTWLTTVQSSMFPGQNITYTTTVNSVQQVIENNINLKQLNVTVKYLTITLNKTITERYGTGYLFDFYHMNGACHADRFTDFLCYSDFTFGTKMFSSKSCEFSNPVGIKENTQVNSTILIHPNPSSTQLNISVSDENLKSIQLLDLSGKSVLFTTFESQQTIYTIDVSHLTQGLYIAQIQTNKGKQFVKIFKE